MSGSLSLANTMMFFTLWKRRACLTSLMLFTSLACTTSLSLNSERTLTPSLEDGIIILYGEGGLTPEQLWCMGHLQDMDEGEALEELQDPGIDWESAVLHEDSSGAVVVPDIECKFEEEALEELQRTINPLEHSQSHGRDLYLQFLHSMSN